MRRQLEAQSESAKTELSQAQERLHKIMQNVPTLAPPTGRHGEWTIIIRGSGPHHNGLESDANHLAMRYIADLRAHGHDVVSAAWDDGAEAESLDITTTGEGQKP